VALAISAAGGEQALPHQAPPIMSWLVALPIGVRVLVAISAGVVEESFFRGFLQPRIGITLSTACFVLAHLTYDQPFLLVGVTLLSVFFALLVRWRQTIWPAVVAHAMFDGIQLLVVIPMALKFLPGELPKQVPAALLQLLG
jgi:membrane protease YdiL (CAAX protease family)